MLELTRATFALAVAASLVALPARVAHAAGPGCDAGAPCPDSDGDGFIACTCALPGEACDCDDADPLTFPGAPEACDAPKDRSCNGGAGFACGPRKGCVAGVCVPECIPLDDFGCAVGSQCTSFPNDTRLCVQKGCTVFGCPPGMTCDDSDVCVPSCPAGVRCPQGQRCRGFGCVDPCDGVTCILGATCVEGRCVAACDCVPGLTGCPPGVACDTTTSPARCVEPACVGVACPPGLHCEGGSCVDDCRGVLCPPERVCRVVVPDGGSVARGECVDLCASEPCKLPFTCDWRTGECLPPKLPEAGLDPGAFDAGPEGAGVVVVGAGGCGTSGLVGASLGGGGAGLALVAAVALSGRARRRPRR